jgi:hypothetical protein
VLRDEEEGSVEDEIDTGTETVSQEETVPPQVVSAPPEVLIINDETPHRPVLHAAGELLTPGLREEI